MSAAFCSGRARRYSSWKSPPWPIGLELSMVTDKHHAAASLFGVLECAAELVIVRH